MIISRTPFRVSFFGGGTDYPVWYRQHGGATLATTINKYCYITCRWLPPFFEHTSRIVWSEIETVKDHAEIRHPAVREALQFLGIRQGIELHHDGDLPARTGLGSSSSFAVGLLHALYALREIRPEKRRLAAEAIRLEQDLLKENVGSQDQIMAAFGGFNRIEFSADGSFQVIPMPIDPDRLGLLQEHLMLIYTGISRSASEIAGEQIRAIPSKAKEFRQLHQMVGQAVSILEGKEDLVSFGRLLHEGWLLKKRLAPRISSEPIDGMVEAALQAGAVGGKLLGAGGGGFLLLFVRPQEQPAVEAVLRGLLRVPFQFENSGSQIIFYGADGAERAPLPLEMKVP